MISAISNALTGLSTASKQVEKNAENIANSTTTGADTVELSEEAIKLKLSETAYKANLATIKTADEMNDALLNLFDETV
jgi:flagellar hook protein FlgE